MTVALLTLMLAAPALAFAGWPLFRSRAGLAPALDDDERAGIENEKYTALRALRELELDRLAGHVDAEDYRELHSRYEAHAVSVLRRLDALGPATRAARAAPVTAAAQPTPWTRQPVVLGAGGAGLLVFGVVLGLLVSRHSTPAPPEPAQVTAQPGMPSAVPPGAPGDGPPRPLSKEMLEGMLQAAHASSRCRPLPGGDRRLPGHPQARPAQPGCHHPPGRHPRDRRPHAEALEAFDRALAIDPDYADALWDKAGVLEARQDHAGAVATLERFVRVSPRGSRP